MNHLPRVAVIGGGIAGLTTAFRLRQSGVVAPIVFERDPRVGGTARTIREGGYLLETGPNGFLDNKPDTLDLCRDLGMETELRRADRSAARRFVFLGDRLRELPAKPAGFLASDLLSWGGKVRALAERFVPRKLGRGDESIRAFGCRRLGREATDVLLDAFVTGILAGDPALLSLPACFPRIAELEQEFGSLLRAQVELARRRRRLAKSAPEQAMGAPGGALTAPVGGMGAIPTVLAQQLGDAVRVGETVTAVVPAALGWRVATDASPSGWGVDAVVSACPAPAQSRLLRSVDPMLADELAAVPYTTAVVASLGYHDSDIPHSTSGFGYLAPERLGRPVLGVIFSSEIFPNHAPPGQRQFRAILGGWRRSDVIDWPDADIIQAVRTDLRRALGIDAAPVFTWLHRWRRAIPQYHVGHLARRERVEQRLALFPGLFLTGSSLHGVSFNDCVHHANVTAAKVLAFLAAGRERGREPA